MTQEISGLMDGELTEAETERLVKLLHEDEALNPTWRGYHVIGDVLRAEFEERQGLETRILAQLQQEPTVLAPRRWLPREIFPRVALAAAASVATISVVAWLAFVQDPVRQSQVAQVPVESALQPAPLGQVETYLHAHKEFSPAPEGLMSAGFSQAREQDAPR